jgi:hypothetical protein
VSKRASENVAIARAVQLLRLRARRALGEEEDAGRSIIALHALRVRARVRARVRVRVRVSVRVG